MMFKNYRSLDGLIHTQRIIQFHQALSLGQFPVRLAPSIMDEVGYPLFVVNYQLPYYAAEIFMLVNQNPVLAYKAVMSISFLLSGIFAYLLFRTFGSAPASLTGSILYTYLPYRFANLYMRGALGESVSLTFVPLILYGIHKINQRAKTGILILAISTFGLITSHTVTLILFGPFIALYIFLIIRPQTKRLITMCAGFAWGFLLAAFQISPSIFEKKYLMLDQSFGNVYKDLFVNFYQLARIPQPGINTGTYIQIGIAATLIILVGLALIVIKKSLYSLFFTAFALVSIFLVTGSSRWIWDNLPLIGYISYPYRFLSLTILCTSFLGVYLVDSTGLKKLFSGFLIILVLYTNRHFYLFAKPNFEIQPPPNLTTQNESDTIWQNEKTLLQRPLLTSNPNSNFTIIKNEPMDVSFQVNTTNSTEFTARKMFFPGWQLKVDNQNHPQIIKDGLISFILDPGPHNVRIFFKETVIRQLGNYVSLFSLILLIVTLLRPNFFKIK